MSEKNIKNIVFSVALTTIVVIYGVSKLSCKCTKENNNPYTDGKDTTTYLEWEKETYGIAPIF